MPAYLRELGRAARTAARVRRPVQLARVRRRPAARPAVGRLGGQGTAARPSSSAVRWSRPWCSRSPPWPASRGSWRWPLLLIGFQLGNTGVMLAGDPRRRAARAPGDGDRGVRGGRARSGSRSARSSRGHPDRPGGLVDLGVYGLAAVLSVGTALLVGLGTREVRPEVIPTGPVLRLAFGACAASSADPVDPAPVRVYGVVFLANQVSRPYVPVLVERLAGSGPGLASGIGLVAGVGRPVGALISPFAGWLGDRVGFRPVLVVALACGGVASLLMPLMPGVRDPRASCGRAGSGGCHDTSAMVFALLATKVPPERRRATLNLVYLPLYLAGIVGPTLGAGVRRGRGRRARFRGRRSVLRGRSGAGAPRATPPSPAASRCPGVSQGRRARPRARPLTGSTRRSASCRPPRAAGSSGGGRTARQARCTGRRAG